jgi:hypothetical protein
VNPYLRDLDGFAPVVGEQHDSVGTFYDDIAECPQCAPCKRHAALLTGTAQ